MSRVLRVKSDLNYEVFTVTISPDTIIEKNTFTSKDRRIVLDIYRKLQKHDWFSKVRLGELEDGSITLTMKFNEVGTHDEQPILEDFIL